MDYDVERIERELERVGAKEGCPVCDKTEWRIQPDIAAFIPSVANGVIEGGHGIPAIPFVCTNCGFVRLHDFRILLGEDV